MVQPVTPHKPSHPGLFYVRFAPGDCMSSLHAIKSFACNEKICQLTGWVEGDRTRLSFQCGVAEHLEFNTDLVFANHSCAPNIGLDLSSKDRDEWAVFAIKDIAEGDELTWFYPSTEWDAWGGGFTCRCGSEQCIGVYRGSKELGWELLSQYPFIQPHVLLLSKTTKPAHGSERHLRIAYAFDRASDYLALGYDAEKCAEFDADHTIDCIATSLRRLGEVEMIGNFPSLISRLASGAYKEWDIVFNYTEGISGVTREAQTPIVLEALGVPFTLSGAATQVLCLDKAQTKMLLQFYNVPTAPFAIIPGVSSNSMIPVDYAASSIQESPFYSQFTFPLFAKPVAEGSSMGVYPSSRIDSPHDLEASVSLLLARFPTQNVLIEPFLTGREFNVSVLGTGSKARVVGVIEYVFNRPNTDSNGLEMVDFLSYDLKNASVGLKPDLVKCDLTDSLIKLVAATALKAWKVTGCFDAGSVDIRCDRQGDGAIPLVLEVNTIPGLSPDRAVFSVCSRANGITFDELIAEIVNGALNRARA